MDIKLKAKLSAYSKIANVGGVDLDDIPLVSHDQIDSLFSKDIDPEIVTKNEIDELFIPSDEYEAVTHEAIDSLFK